MIRTYETLTNSPLKRDTSEQQTAATISLPSTNLFVLSNVEVDKLPVKELNDLNLISTLSASDHTDVVTEVLLLQILLGEVLLVMTLSNLTP